MFNISQTSKEGNNIINTVNPLQAMKGFILQ